MQILSRSVPVVSTTLNLPCAPSIPFKYLRRRSLKLSAALTSIRNLSSPVSKQNAAYPFPKCKDKNGPWHTFITGVFDPVGQGRNVALATAVPTKSSGRAIALQQNSVFISCSDLCISNPFWRTWDVALAIAVITKSSGRAIALQHNRVLISCIDLCISNPFWRTWDVALTTAVPAKSSSQRARESES